MTCCIVCKYVCVYHMVIPLAWNFKQLLGIVRTWIVIYDTKFFFLYKRIPFPLHWQFLTQSIEKQKIKEQFKKKKKNVQQTNERPTDWTNKQEKKKLNIHSSWQAYTIQFRWKTEILFKEKCKRALHYCCSSQTCNNSI